MKEAWCIATNRVDLGAAGVVKLYARRFTIEETFRDIKDNHFGRGLSATHIGSVPRSWPPMRRRARARSMKVRNAKAASPCPLRERSRERAGNRGRSVDPLLDNSTGYQRFFERSTIA